MNLINTNNIIRGFYFSIILAIVLIVNIYFASHTKIVLGSTTTPALVQHTTASFGQVTNAQLSFPNNVTAGDLVVVAVAFNGSSASVSGGFDNFSPTSSAFSVPNNGGFNNMQIFYASGSAGGYNQINVSQAGEANYLEMFIMEFSGVSATFPVDTTSQSMGLGNANSGTTQTSGPDLVLGFFSNNNKFGFIPSNGFMQIDTTANKDMTEYIIQSTASSISASANSTYNWAAQMVAFRPASLGGNPTPINNPPPSATTTLPITQISSGNSNLDMYGGSTSLQCPSGPKATFYTQKIGNRWVFCDPLGNVFWMKAVYVLDSTDGGNTYNSIISNKYTAGAWPQQTLTRLKSWGFNTVGPYAGLGGHNMLPVSTYGSQANPVKMPFLRQIELSNWCLPQTKNIYSESNPVVYSSNNQFPDVYDPAWIACVNTVATNSGDPSLFGNNLSQNANYMIGTWIGDTDYLAGFNRGPATPGGAAPHLGWIAATTNPAPGGSTNYTKQAWQNYIQKKYSTIAALNTAWGSNYTSFASAGGWPKKTTKGSGLLDEDGSSAWMGNGSADIVGANANAKADMDNFLELLAEQYYKTATNAIRTAFPNNLVFGSGALNAQTYPQILQAAGKYLDVIEIWAEPVFQANSSVLGSAYNLSGKPLEIWTTLTSQGETSANGGTAWGTGPCTGDYDFCTQALRGAGYQSLINTYLNTKGSDGTFPIIGLDWWEYTDKVTGGENMNFGLVSSRDNAYDGIEDHSGNQPCLPENVTAGFNCGGEPGNYGNFIGPVTTANTSVYSMLASQINGISLPPVTITTPPTIVSNPPVVITTIPVSTTSPVIPPLSVVNNQNSTSGGGGSPGNPTNINTTTTPQKIYNFGTTTLRYGNKNGAVKELQMFLNYKFNLHLVVDGKFGSKTLILVKKWQTANNLTPDGIVGLKTKAKMNASV